jgi:hypothetical protein
MELVSSSAGDFCGITGSGFLLELDFLTTFLGLDAGSDIICDFY